MKDVCAGLFVGGVSWVFLLLGLLFALKTLYLLRRGVRAEATVVDFEVDGEGSSYPVVEFAGQSGATHRVKLSVSGGGERLGTKTTVVYAAADPTYLIGTSLSQAWVFAVGFVFLGGVGVAIGVGILFGGIPVN